jgi:hypothetical protein
VGNYHEGNMMHYSMKSPVIPCQKESNLAQVDWLHARLAQAMGCMPDWLNEPTFVSGTMKSPTT